MDPLADDREGFLPVNSTQSIMPGGAFKPKETRMITINLYGTPFAVRYQIRREQERTAQAKVDAEEDRRLIKEVG